MADAGTVTAAWGITTAVSAWYQVSKKQDPFPVIMACGLGYGATAIIGQFLDWQLAAVIAGVMALGVILYRSGPIVNGAVSLVNSKKPS